MSLIENRKARFNYEILETFEAGIELLGNEVKSLRAHRGVFDGAYVSVRGGEAFLVKLSIPAYQSANTPKEYDPERSRRLLLRKKEISRLADAETEKGLTIIPLSLYSKDRFIKAQIAIAKGKKEYDKRETSKKRATDREMRRIVKGN